MIRKQLLSILLLCPFGVALAQIHTYGHAPAPSPAQTLVNACSLLSAQTATTLYKSPVTQAGNASAAASSMSLCLFTDARKDGVVSFLVQNIPQGMEKTMMDSVTQGDAKSHVTPVAGLGEQAVFKVDSTAVMLAVFIHNRLVVLGVNGPDTAARRTTMTSVMRQIIVHL